MEQQADFLLDSSCWWGETDEGVTFFDYSETDRSLDRATNATLHHWRSYTMKDEIIYLQQCWEKCLENMHSIIPAHKIRIKNSNGNINFILLNTLEYFRKMHPENLETNETLNETDINFEVAHTSKENFSLTPIPNQNLNLSPVLQKSSTTYPSTPLKSKTKSLPEEACNKLPITSTPNPNKMAATAQTTVSHLAPLTESFSSCNNRKYSNSSKMLIFLLGTSSNIDKFDKLRKSLKENKKRGLYSDELLLNECKSIAATLQVKVELLEEILHQKLSKIHIEKVIEGDDCSTSDEKTIIRKLKYVNQLKKDLNSSFDVQGGR